MRTDWYVVVHADNGIITIDLDAIVLTKQYINAEVIDAHYIKEPKRFTVENVQTIYNLYKDYGEPALAFINYVFNHDCDKIQELFEDRYIGTFPSLSEYGMHVWEEQGVLEGIKALGLSEDYLDSEAFGTDMYRNGDIRFGTIDDVDEDSYKQIAIFSTK